MQQTEEASKPAEAETTPDPSSQLACMIGGNVNMNSGGAHCLKYGVTANNLLGLKIVTVEGEILAIGGAHLDAAGYDWLGLLTGSEGQLAVVTEVTVRILRSPEGARAMLAAFHITFFGTQPTLTWREGLRAVEVIEAARRSAGRSGAWVPLPLCPDLEQLEGR